MSTATETRILTAEEFARRPNPGYLEELVRGKIRAMPPTGARHGQVCWKVARFLGNFVEDNRLGHLLTNDTGLITDRDPDSVRGSDLAYYSFTKLPPGPLPPGYPGVVADLVIEVQSPSDRWGELLQKVGEYLLAGVGVVLLVEPERRSVHVYEGDAPVRLLGEDDTLELPSLFERGPGIPIGRLFE